MNHDKRESLKQCSPVPFESFTAGEVAKRLNDSRRFVQVTMGMMSRAGVLVKADRGYRLKKVDPLAESESVA